MTEKYSELRPHWSDYNDTAAEILKAVSSAIDPSSDRDPDDLNDDIAVIVSKAVAQGLVEFHKKAERIERQLEQWWSRPTPPAPPLECLLRKLIQHVNELDNSEFIVTARASSVEFTPEERAILYRLEVEGIEQKRRAT